MDVSEYLLQKTKKYFDCSKMRLKVSREDFATTGS